MVASMTAFGRSEAKGDWGRAVWEIRSVNHRYLELGLRLPEDLRILEGTVRERISARIGRGKVDCSLRFDADEAVGGELLVNHEFAGKLIQASEQIAERMPGAAAATPLDILRWPGVLLRDPPDPESLSKPLMDLLDQTLDAVIENREREGKKLAELIGERCTTAQQLVTQLRKQLPDILTNIRERLIKKAEELRIEIERERLDQELLLLAQRYDVAEELDRFETHLTEIQHVLGQSGQIGRRLDFLMQELNREANTLGSKTAHIDYSNTSVDLKVLIEQMRE
ncbi:MAG: YicC/YloC family endoribonuclease, partial [Gammaproteobacteria bacterium]